MDKKQKKSMVSITQVKNNKVEIFEPEKIETVEKDYVLVIRTSTGPIELVGQKHELMKFLDQLEDPKNRQKFLRCPQHLLTWAPWLEVVAVRPADVGAIVIKDQSKAPQRNQGILAPVGVRSGGPIPR